jgi:hypothetical protein
MRQENFEKVLRVFLDQTPFRPFTLELLSGTRIEINHPEALTMREDGLIIVASTSSTRSVLDVGAVVRFISATGIA